MKFAVLLDRLADFHRRVFPQRDAFYTRFERTPAAEEAAIEALEAVRPHGLEPSLIDSWREAASVRFEWFLKADGARAAGIDSREAPTGQFNFFSPAEVITETEFLADLAGVPRDQVQLLPFARLNPNGELVALDLSTETPAVVAVVLDLTLSTVYLAPSLSEWYEQRIKTFFADETLDPSCEASDILDATLECLTDTPVYWPPKRKVNW